MRWASIFFVLALGILSASNLCAVYGKTYISFRPAFEVGTPERLALVHDAMTAREDGHGGTVQIVGFGGRTASAVDLARYFLPNDRACLRVAEDMNNNFLIADINAGCFHVVSVPTAGLGFDDFREQQATNMTFQSMLNFAPYRHEFGVGGIYLQQLPKNFWFDVSACVVQARQSLCVCENVINRGGTGPDESQYYANMTAMMNSCTKPFCYSNLTNKCMKITRCPQVEIRIGDSFTHCGDDQTNGFIGLMIPTGNKPCQCYLFEPVVGNNRHWGGFFGFNGNYLFSRTDTHTINMHIDLVARYLFPNTQLRSFDLKGRPWSRYLPVWKSRTVLPDPSVAANASTIYAQLAPLVNYSTLCAQIIPNWSADLLTSLQFKKHGFSAEVGYHAYTKEAENLCWCCTSLSKGLGVAAVSASLDQTQWQTTNHEYPVTKSFEKPSDYCVAASPLVSDSRPVVTNSVITGWSPTYVELTIDDLDQDSALQPAVFAQGVYATLGYTWYDCTYPPMLFVGGSYECANDNSYINNWKAWIRFGVAF